MGGTTEQTLLGDYERQTSWVPTEEWIAWSATFDRRIGFHEDDRSPDEQDARAYAAVEPHHRGGAGNLSGETSIDQPWTVSTDVVTVTPRGARMVERWVKDTDDRVAQARESLVLHGHVRHINRHATRTNRRPTTRTALEEQAVHDEAQEIIRVLAEYGASTPA